MIRLQAQVSGCPGRSRLPDVFARRVTTDLRVPVALRSPAEARKARPMKEGPATQALLNVP